MTTSKRPITLRLPICEVSVDEVAGQQAIGRRFLAKIGVFSGLGETLNGRFGFIC